MDGNTTDDRYYDHEYATPMLAFILHFSWILVSVEILEYLEATFDKNLHVSFFSIIIHRNGNKSENIDAYREKNSSQSSGYRL